MNRFSWFFVFVLAVAQIMVPAKSGVASEENPKMAALGNLRLEYPDLKAFREDWGLTRLYGVPFGQGSSPEITAEQFRLNRSVIFGVEPQDLEPGSILLDGRHTQPLMYNRLTGEYKFTLVYYSQYRDEVPVFRSDLRLLVRNTIGYPLVMAASSLRDLGDFSVTGGTVVNSTMAESAARSFSPGLTEFTEPHLVIWAGIDNMDVEPAVAMEIIADNGMYATLDYEKWLLLVDTQTGKILYSENMILEIDITGGVMGLATQGNGADICGPEWPTPMPYARVYVQGGNTAYADQYGNFVIPHGGSTPVDVYSHLRGEWFRVYNQNGGDAEIMLEITPPGPANFTHNSGNANEYERAEVNGYLHANIVRDFTLTYNPAYPGLQQNEFPVNVNLNDNCNAYYDYSSINFFTSGGGCANTAFSTVVHHEYGHHLVYLAGSGQGAYGEGMGDVMGILITDDPGLAYGFFGNCGEYMRTGDNNLQYPCSGEIHYCGQLISGCVWETRNELAITYPTTYIDTIANLAVNAMLLHSGTDITPSITIDYLTLDDDNGNIYDGTPHWSEICAGFSAHNMDCPELQLLGFNYPNGRPELINPAGGTTIRVQVYGVAGSPEPGTGELHYNSGSGWITQAMNVVSPNVYDAVFPSFDCGDAILYYFSAETDQGYVVTDPPNAPAVAFSAFSATGLITAFEDNFNSDLGWTVVNNCADGQWERAVPAGGGDRGDPPTDYDGSGYCYVTDNADDNSDVDDGYTYLLSPTFDLSSTNGIINYALWYTNNTGNDPNNDVFNVYVSSNNGNNWTLVETFGPITSAGWTEHSFVVGSYVTPSSQVKVRFEASDLNNGSIVEAGIDAVSLLTPECGEVPSGTITGTVTDINGPISGVQVFADDGSGNTGSDATIGDGTYSMLVPASTYEVSFSHPDYRDTTITDVVVTEDGTTIVDVVMEELEITIPTLSEWGMIILALLLLAAGTAAVIRRRRSMLCRDGS